MDQVSEVIDEDNYTAKELWDALISLCTTSNTQAVIKFEQELETVNYKDGQDWQKHKKMLPRAPRKVGYT